MKGEKERDYSGRSLFDKLGVLADSHVALVGRHDEAFTTALDERLAKAASQALRTQYDLIFVRIDRPHDLARLARAAEYLRPKGALWVFHPKGRGASPSDDEVRSAGLAAGLVDNKISAYTESHTATRFVIPVAQRGSRAERETAAASNSGA
jgi:predicted O-methyltransferase YrrM